VSGKAGVAVAAAYSQIGVPYKFAAESPDVAFDCSGLTKWSWGRAGVYLPHQSGAQFGSTARVSRDQVQPGDLIFYYTPIGHVGIYVGGGQMIHAVNTGTTVALAPVRWNKVVGIGRPG
jgi:cell wall-associated NlpC family hydrolase